VLLPTGLTLSCCWNIRDLENVSGEEVKLAQQQHGISKEMLLRGSSRIVLGCIEGQVTKITVSPNFSAKLFNRL
jgi:hypothetical protein